MLITHSYSAPPEANRAFKRRDTPQRYGGGQEQERCPGAQHLTCRVTGVSQRHINL